MEYVVAGIVTIIVIGAMIYLVRRKGPGSPYAGGRSGPTQRPK